MIEAALNETPAEPTPCVGADLARRIMGTNNGDRHGFLSAFLSVIEALFQAFTPCPPRPAPYLSRR